MPLIAACAGGLGAAGRLSLDGWIRAHSKTSYPLGTTIINVSGSLVLGFVTGLALGGEISGQWRLILATGFLGGYTTFSTATFETVRLLQQRRYLAALSNGFAMLVASVAAAAAGLWLGGLA